MERKKEKTGKRKERKKEKNVCIFHPLRAIL
jgi:hypothetical protein